jgi:hypothetical protein
MDNTGTHIPSLLGFALNNVSLSAVFNIRYARVSGKVNINIYCKQAAYCFRLYVLDTLPLSFLCWRLWLTGHLHSLDYTDYNSGNTNFNIFELGVKGFPQTQLLYYGL